MSAAARAEDEWMRGRDEEAARADGASIESLPQAVRAFFSFRGPRLLAKSAMAATAARVALGPPGVSDALVCAGVLAYWPVQEWLVHRYFLHVKPSPRFDPWFAKVHRAHHREPGDLELSLLPMPILRNAVPANAALWMALSPSKRGALTGIAASSWMALFYEWSHFLVHTGYRPKSRWFRKVRRNHRLHHFHNEGYWFGFTATLVDALLGTDPEARQVPHSATARDLHGLSAEEAAAG